MTDTKLSLIEYFEVLEAELPPEMKVQNEADAVESVQAGVHAVYCIHIIPLVAAARQTGEDGESKWIFEEIKRTREEWGYVNQATRVVMAARDRGEHMVPLDKIPEYVKQFLPHEDFPGYE